MRRKTLIAAQTVTTGTAGTLAVARLTLSNFRNYANARIEPRGRAVVLTGANGAGKTNLLEAVSFLAPGRGLRRVRVSEVDRRLPGVDDGAEGPVLPWAVAAELETGAGPVSIGTGRDAEAGERRVVRINGAPVKSQSALGDYVSIVWLTPQMDGLFLDSAGARRRFLDRLIYGFDPAHAGRLNAYDQALRERSRLLKDGCSDHRWLGALEAQLVERGIAIAAARLDITGRLDRACREGHGPFPGAGLEVEGAVEGWLASGPALEAEEHFAAALAGGRMEDAHSGGASVGPHRSDLRVRHLGRNMPAEACSTGEQKAVLIAIVLAHARLQTAETGQSPLLLLDDVAAHLDSERRNALFDTILSLNAQTWLTGTDRELFDGLGDAADRYRVTDAVIATDG